MKIYYFFTACWYSYGFFYLQVYTYQYASLISVALKVSGERYTYLTFLCLPQQKQSGYLTKNVIMVPWLLVFSECYQRLDSVENTQNFHSMEVVKSSCNSIIIIYLDRNTFVLLLLSHFATLWTVARQALLPVGFSRQEYWRELPFPSPRKL